MTFARFRALTARTDVVVALIFLVALLPLLLTPIFPFIDLYNHLARYFVLAHLADSPLLQKDYAANWSLLPNIGLDVIGTAMLRVVPQAFAAHVVVIVIFAVQYGGLLAFNRVLTGRTSPLVALLIVPLLYSFILNWGFANFLLGLGLVFAAAAWWLRRRDRLTVGLPVACVAAVAIFLTHGLAFALYGLLVVALEVGLWLQLPARRVAGLVRALVPVAVQAIVPVLLFLAAPTSRAMGGVSNAGDRIAGLANVGALGDRLWTLFGYRLTTIVRVEEGPALWFDAVTLATQIGIVAWLIWRGRATISRTVLPAIAVGVVLVALVPPAMFGVGYIADRMPLFLACIVVGGLTFRLKFDVGDRAAVALLAMIIAVRLIAITVDWQSYRRDLAEFDRIAALIPPGASVVDVVAGGNRHQDAPRCQMYRPLLISLHGAIGPLFANESQQPLRLVGPLRGSLDHLVRLMGPTSALNDDYRRVAAAAGPAGFDYLLICHAAPLPRLPAGHVVANLSRFTLLDFPRASGG